MWQIKHRKSEIAHERGGMLGSLGQVLTGPRFHETDEVRAYAMQSIQELTFA